METVDANAEDVAWFPVEESSAPGRVRRAAASLAAKLAFSEHRAGEVAIASTELATNLSRHAIEGAVLLRVRRAGDDAAIELIVVDAGPGMHDVDASARDGTSTGGTLGIGLGAAMRLASTFDSHSVVGRGTVTIATFWRNAPPRDDRSVGAMTRPMAGEHVCGDAAAYRRDGSVTTIMLADGLGHGDLAAQAAQLAVRAFFAFAETPAPARALEHLDRALRGSRGAALAVVRIEPDAPALTFAGVGNVATWIVADHGRQSLVSTPGIVGALARPVREVRVALPAESLVVLHSDGLTSKWTLDAYPGLRKRDPHLVAATLLRDAGVRRDDASIAVARAS